MSNLSYKICAVKNVPTNFVWEYEVYRDGKLIKESKGVYPTRDHAEEAAIKYISTNSERKLSNMAKGKKPKGKKC